MIAQKGKRRCTIFALFFGHFQTRKNKCGVVVEGARKLRQEKLERLKKGIKNLTEFADNLGRQMQIVRREKYLKPKSLETIEKKLEKKNLEFEEVREFRKKLNEKDKEICVVIEKLDVSLESVLKMLGALRENQVSATEKSL